MAVNIADLFEHAVDAMPERLAVACEDRQVSFAELEARANKLAHHLAKHGVGKGSHVGVYAQNSIEVVETMLAVYKLRATAINVNYRYVENELRYLFDNADLVALVHERQYAPRVAAVRPEMPKLKHVVVIEDGSDAAYDGVEYEEALAGESPERDFGPREADDLYILYTGGTTGYPKGVMWRHEDVWRTLGGGIDFVTGVPLEDEFAQSKLGVQHGSLTRHCVAPLIHGAAQWATLAALFAGSAVVLSRHFDPVEVWRTIEQRKVNVLLVVGDAMARPLIEEYQRGGYDASSLFAVSSHAALFSPAVKQQYLDALPNLVLTDAVGSSESGFNGIGMVARDTDESAGPRVKLGPHITVIDEYNRPVEPGSGVVGRIARSGHIPLGYYKDQAKTDALYVEVDGVRHVVPGDCARIEADGTMTLLGRGNMCVNTGGEKVFPEEVEAALKTFPQVYDALVVGVPDDLLGQRVAALVQPRDGAELDLKKLDAHLHREIAGYKVPRSIWLVDEIGRLPSGKPNYRWAREHVTSSTPSPVA